MVQEQTWKKIAIYVVMDKGWFDTHFDEGGLLCISMRKTGQQMHHSKILKVRLCQTIGHVLPSFCFDIGFQWYQVMGFYTTFVCLFVWLIWCLHRGIEVAGYAVASLRSYHKPCWFSIKGEPGVSNFQALPFGLELTQKYFCYCIILDKISTYLVGFESNQSLKHATP